MYNKYLPFLLKHIKLYYLPHIDREDRLQECYIVLYHAMKTYDDSKSVTFFAYYKVLLERHFYKMIRQQMAKKRQSEQLDHVLEDYEVSQFQGSGYAQSLNPEDIVIVQEKLLESYQLLSDIELKSLKDKYLHNHITDSKYAYRGKYKMRKVIKSK